jgi:hypothetical protein
MSGEMIDTDGDVVGENLNPRARGRLWVTARDGKRRLVAETCGGCGELVRVGEPHSHRRAPPAPKRCRVTIVRVTSDAWDDLLAVYLDACATARYDVSHGPRPLPAEPAVAPIAA